MKSNNDSAFATVSNWNGEQTVYGRFATEAEALASIDSDWEVHIADDLVVVAAADLQDDAEDFCG